MVNKNRTLSSHIESVINSHLLNARIVELILIFCLLKILLQKIPSKTMLNVAATPLPLSFPKR